MAVLDEDREIIKRHGFDIKKGMFSKPGGAEGISVFGEYHKGQYTIILKLEKTSTRGLDELTEQVDSEIQRACLELEEKLEPIKREAGIPEEVSVGTYSISFNPHEISITGEDFEESYLKLVQAAKAIGIEL